MKPHPSKPEDSWVVKTCNSIGAEDDTVPLSRPPAEAIEAVRKLIMGYVGMNSSHIASNPMKKIHAPLLEAWRAAARGPGHWVPVWLSTCAPAGILRLVEDPAIFPDCTSPSEQRPEDMYCAEHNFRNYSGVEEHEVTATELEGHIDADTSLSLTRTKNSPAAWEASPSRTRSDSL